jgi:plasmid stabilization system protein ParE
VNVSWTHAAIVQLELIHNYVAQTSPEYAQRIVERLTKRSKQIATFPLSGRIVPEYELNMVREVIEGSHRILYLIKNEQEQIEILAVIHTSRERLKPLE